jgi:tRNA(Ile)-lysidine synthase
LLRPLLSHPRAELHDHAARHGLSFVEDPSNQDTRLARNALRREVLPPLERLRPGYRQGALRSLELLAEAAQVQRELAQEGLAHCSQDAPAGMLRIDRLATLSPARQALALRAWLAQAGLAPPSRARLQEVLAQSFGARDGRMLVRLGQTELRRHRGLLCLREAVPVVPEGETLRWQGEAELPVPSWGGALHFIEDPAGFDAHWLRAAPLELRLRTGGERFKPHPLRPSRRLKQLFQEAGIPEFERGGLPLVWRAGRLIFVAGLGADARLANGYVPRVEGVPGTGRVRLEWLGEARLLSERL